MSTTKSDRLIDSGYHEALKLARSHYENFPVVSLMIPVHLKKDIAIIYWFARTADDFSDEGNHSESDRLQNLNSMEERLRNLLNNQPDTHFDAALRNTIISKNLDPQNFYKLLKAFKQDVVKSRYENFDEVIDYCSNSANPVGRIMLELFKITDEKAFFYSDKICTALQITNFIQDTKIDYQKGRIYYPLDEMSRFEVAEKVFEMKIINPNLKKLIEFSVGRVQKLFDEGKPILDYLSGRFKYEIAWTINGGEEILNKIRGADFDIISKRSFLTKVDYLKIFLISFYRQ